MTGQEAWYGGPAQPAVTRPGPAGKKRRYPLWNGEYVRLRGPQMIVHGLVVAFLFGCLGSGIYFGATQVHWYLPVGPAWLRHGVWLKPWWDAGKFWPAFLGHWPSYRHVAFRDQAIPQIVTLGVLTVIAKDRWWDRRVSTPRMVISPFVLIAGVFTLGVLGVWLNLFGLPWAWAHAWSAAGRPGFTLDGSFAWAARWSLFILIWGYAAGKLLHRWWAPAGATIQGLLLDRSADRHRDAARESGGESVPLWVRLPLVAPVIRERWSRLYQMPDDGRVLARAGRVKRAALTLMVLACGWLIILGFIGHYVVSIMGIHVPYLAP